MKISRIMIGLFGAIVTLLPGRLWADPNNPLCKARTCTADEQAMSCAFGDFVGCIYYDYTGDDRDNPCDEVECICISTKVSKHGLCYCPDGFYAEMDALCIECPPNATCTVGDNFTFKCNKGFYRKGDGCEQCPSSGGINGTTSGLGATSITQCYLPSGTDFGDNTGSGKYADNCYYKE